MFTYRSCLKKLKRFFRHRTNTKVIQSDKTTNRRTDGQTDRPKLISLRFSESAEQKSEGILHY